MADTLVRSLGSLIEERKALQRKEQHLAERQLQLIKGLDQLLHSIGYQLTAVGNNRGPAPSLGGVIKTRLASTSSAHSVTDDLHIAARSLDM